MFANGFARKPSDGGSGRASSRSLVVLLKYVSSTLDAVVPERAASMPASNSVPRSALERVVARVVRDGTGSRCAPVMANGAAENVVSDAPGFGRAARGAPRRAQADLREEAQRAARRTRSSEITHDAPTFGQEERRASRRSPNDEFWSIRSAELEEAAVAAARAAARRGSRAPSCSVNAAAARARGGVARRCWRRW